MIIKEVKVYALQAKLDNPFYFSQGWAYNRSAVIVELIDENGLSGFGESLCHGMQPPQIAVSIIENLFVPHLIGKSIFETDKVWEEIYTQSRPFGQAAVINALSSINIAMWDLQGKNLKQPIANLLGGRYRDSVQAYSTGFYRQDGKSYPQDAVEEALRYESYGFKAMKLKCGFGVETDVEYIKAVKSSVKNDTKIMVDFNCAYNQAQARRIIKELEDYKIEFFEELLSADDKEGYKAIRNLSSAYIAAGENTFSKATFSEWMNEGALDIYQPDLCSCGGFTEYKKIMAIAQATNSTIIPHIWGSGIALAASLQLIATIAPNPIRLMPDNQFLEYDQSSHPFRADLICNAINMKDGFVSIPNANGIGVEVNRDILERYNSNK